MKRIFLLFLFLFILLHSCYALDGTFEVYNESDSIFNVSNVGNVEFYNSFYWDAINGYLGIGIINPVQKLHIYNSTGNVFLRLETDGADSISGLRLLNDAITWTLRTNTNDNFNIRDTTAGITRFTIDTSGRVGIGVNSLSNKLEVNGSMNASSIFEGLNRVLTSENKTINYSSYSNHSIYSDNATVATILDTGTIYIDTDIDDEHIEGDLNTYVDIAGDTMVGPLNVLDIINVTKVCINSSDCTTYMSSNGTTLTLSGSTVKLNIH